MDVDVFITECPFRVRQQAGVPVPTATPPLLTGPACHLQGFVHLIQQYNIVVNSVMLYSFIVEILYYKFIVKSFGQPIQFFLISGNSLLIWEIKPKMKSNI